MLSLGNSSSLELLTYPYSECVMMNSLSMLTAQSVFVLSPRGLGLPTTGLFVYCFNGFSRDQVDHSRNPSDTHNQQH